MTKKGLIWILISWVILTLVNYYLIPFFILFLIWIGLCLTLLIMTIIQLSKLIKERKELKKLRLVKFIAFLSLFLLTFYHSATNLLIEKVDWVILENTRTKIVRQVIDKELNPNVSKNSEVCELPFEFPVVSNGGNDIVIVRNKENGKTSVIFWVFRNFFSSPSTHFVFTNDPALMKIIEEKIAFKPENNWKIKDNWYRTYGEE